MAGTSWDRLGSMDEAFIRVAPVIRSLAQAEGVALEEFCNEDPIWRLAFARQAGGHARVDVTWNSDEPNLYEVKAAWILDDYDSTMRRFHQEVIGEYSAEQPLEELDSMLRAALLRIDGWNQDALDSTSGPHPRWHEGQTREEFYRIDLPVRP